MFKIPPQKPFYGCLVFIVKLKKVIVNVVTKCRDRLFLKTAQSGGKAPEQAAVVKMSVDEKYQMIYAHKYFIKEKENISSNIYVI